MTEDFAGELERLADELNQSVYDWNDQVRALRKAARIVWAAQAVMSVGHPTDFAELDAALSAVTSASACEWREDENGLWQTACGCAFEFIDDGPTANKQSFCGYCGKRLIEVAYVEPFEAEAETERT